MKNNQDSQNSQNSQSSRSVKQWFALIWFLFGAAFGGILAELHNRSGSRTSAAAAKEDKALATWAKDGVTHEIKAAEVLKAIQGGSARDIKRAIIWTILSEAGYAEKLQEIMDTEILEEDLDQVRENLRITNQEAMPAEDLEQFASEEHAEMMIRRLQYLQIAHRASKETQATYGGKPLAEEPSVLPGREERVLKNGTKDRLVIFNDYKCPYCKQNEPLWDSLKERHPGLKIELRHLLATRHPQSEGAALTSVCAGKQGSAELARTHKALFLEKDLSRNALRKIAKKAGLHMGDYDQCMESPESLEEIARDREDASRNGVHATPSVFLNGRLIENELLAAIDLAIAQEARP